MGGVAHLENPSREAKARVVADLVGQMGRQDRYLAGIADDFSRLVGVVVEPVVEHGPRTEQEFRLGARLCELERLPGVEVRDVAGRLLPLK